MKNSNRRVFASFLVTAGLLIGIGAAHAQAAAPVEHTGHSGTIVGGVATVPEYQGADNQRFMPFVAGDIRWDNHYVALEGTTARINVLNSKVFEFGPAADLTLGRRKDVRSLPIRALGRIDDAYQFGAFAAVRTTSLLTTGDELRLKIQGTRDVSNVHDGWVGEVAADYHLPIGNKLAINTQATIRFADDRYAQTYFSILPTGAAASGLAVFNAKGGVTDVGASLSATYALSGRWSLVGFGSYRRLVGDFGDSPVVSTAGTRNQLTGGIGLGVSF